MSEKTITILNEKTFDLNQDERDIIADALSDWLSGRVDKNNEMTKIAQNIFERMTDV